MTQKPLKALLLLVFTGLIPVGCCKESRLDYANVRQVFVYLSESTNINVGLTNNSRTRDTALVVTVRLDYDYLAAAPARTWFTGQALALQCPEPGEKGLKDKVAAVSFTSAGLFNGVPAGQSLAQFVRCSAGYGSSPRIEFPLSQLADSLNKWRAGEYRELTTPLQLRISPKPRDNARQQFQVLIRLASGKELGEYTPSVLWE